MGGLKIVAVDFPSHRKLAISENIYFFNENNKESLLINIEKSQKNALKKKI